MLMKTKICKSGLKGWEAKLQKIYTDFEEFVAYSNVYGIAKRLGFKTAKKAWDKNPTIEGSLNPSDLRVVK